MQWFQGLKAWQKVAVVVFLWPLMVAWWFFKSPRFTKKTKGIAAGALGVLVLVSALAGSGQKKEEVVAAGNVSSSEKSGASPSTSSSAPAPTTTTAPTLTTTTAPPPTTTTAADPDAGRKAIETELQNKVSKALGKSNRKASPRVTLSYPTLGERVLVTWAIDENLTEGLTKDTARIEATDILDAIHDVRPNMSGVFLEGTYPLVDKLGNSEETTVVRASYDTQTVMGINYGGGFNFKNVFERGVASSATVHPAFVY
jgi:hypothetical protein